jgi:hypothetical protein
VVVLLAFLSSASYIISAMETIDDIYEERKSLLAAAASLREQGLREQRILRSPPVKAGRILARFPDNLDTYYARIRIPSELESKQMPLTTTTPEERETIN